MSWRDRLQKASFRGFDFLTDGHEAKHGRRLVVHEFPGADDPRIEDLGGKAREWRVNAYFVGANYDLARNRFLTLLAEGGAYWLTHPWLGRVWVRARDWSVSESNERGGICTVAVDFVHGGMAPSAPAVDKVDAAASSVRAASAAVVSDFALQPAPADMATQLRAVVYGQLEGLRRVVSLSALPTAAASQVVAAIQAVKGDIATLLAAPASYATALQSIADQIGAAEGLMDSDRVRVVVRMGVVAQRAVVSSTDANVTAEATLRARLLAIASAEIALADYATAAARDAALAASVAALDALLGDMDDGVFDATWALRTGLIEALQSQALDPAQVRDVVQPLPATLLAHRLDVDEDVFIAANGVTHPLFVAGRVYG